MVWAQGHQRDRNCCSLTLQEHIAIRKSTFLVAVPAVCRRWELNLRWPPALTLYPEAVVILHWSQAGLAFSLAEFTWVVVVFSTL